MTRPPTPADLETLVAADRWRLWSSLLRGLSHRLANVAQMLALDPAPEPALAESRERIGETMAALNALRPASGRAPLLLAPLLVELDRLQALQMDHPAAPLECVLEPGVPALAVRADDVMHLLLACVTAVKEAAGERRAVLQLAVREDGEGARVTLAEREGAVAAPPSEAERALAASMGGRFVDDGAVAVWLPAWKRSGLIG